MLIVEFEYFNKETGVFETDQLECEKFQDFKNWIEDNNIKIYEIMDIRIEQ